MKQLIKDCGNTALCLSLLVASTFANCFPPTYWRTTRGVPSKVVTWWYHPGGNHTTSPTRTHKIHFFFERGCHNSHRFLVLSVCEAGRITLSTPCMCWWTCEETQHVKTKHLRRHINIFSPCFCAVHIFPQWRMSPYTQTHVHHRGLAALERQKGQRCH